MRRKFSSAGCYEPTGSWVATRSANSRSCASCTYRKLEGHVSDRGVGAHLNGLRSVFRLLLAVLVPRQERVRASGKILEREASLGIRPCEPGRRQHEDDAGHPVV